MKMNKIKFVLPIVAIMSLSSCGGSAKATNKGEVPSGGTEINEKDARNEALVDTLNKTKVAIPNLTDFGVAVKSEGLSLELASDKVNGTISIGNFTLNAGLTNLFTGTKDNTRIGLDFSGLKNTMDLTVKPTEETTSELKEENNLGKFSVYLDKGNVYADLSKFGVPELLNKVAKEAVPYLSSLSEFPLFDEDTVTAITTFVNGLAESPENVTTMVGLLFGVFSNFDYKMAFKDVVKDEKYPLLPLAEVLPQEATSEEAISQIKVSFGESTGLDFDEYVKLYQYDDSSLALQITLNKETLNNVLAKAKYDFNYTLNDGLLKAALYFDKDGLPTSLSVINNMDLTLSGEEVTSMFGETLAVKSNLDLNVGLSVGSNPVKFPDNYKDYHSLLSFGSSK